MNKRILIFGTSVFSEELCNIMEEDSGINVEGYILDQKYICSTVFSNKKVYAYEELAHHFEKSTVSILVSIGYSDLNSNRENIIEKCKGDGWQIASYIHPTVDNRSKEIGYGNIILKDVELRYHSVIGNGNIILGNTIISHESIVGNYNYFSGSNHINGLCKIGNNNFFGSASILTDQKEIGNKNIIGAGVCVSQNVKENKMLSQAPCRVTNLNNRMLDLILMRKLQN